MNSLWDYRPRVWDYRESTWTLDGDLVRYDVEATDGCVGTVDYAASDDAGAYVVVDMGSLVPGKKRLVPAGLVAALDHGARKLHLMLTRDEVSAAPDFDPTRCKSLESNQAARREHGQYYRSCATHSSSAGHWAAHSTDTIS